MPLSSAPLADDLYITGPLRVVLTVSCDTAGVNDTDFTAKLTDVYPDGSSHLIQDGIYRMRWRAGNKATSAEKNFQYSTPSLRGPVVVGSDE